MNTLCLMRPQKREKSDLACVLNQREIPFNSWQQEAKNKF